MFELGKAVPECHASKGQKALGSKPHHMLAMSALNAFPTLPLF